MAEESKSVPPLEDIELGKLPVAGGNAIRLSGSKTNLSTTITTSGGPLVAPTASTGPTSLRWNIRKLSVPIKKKHMSSLQGNFELLGQPGGHEQDGVGSSNTNSSSSKRVERNLLYNVVGHAEKGQMLALMGASGAGKTSLLDCISLRNHRFEGNVYLDKQPVDQHFFSTTAYVHQVDLFFATLTVREHLTFHAMVRVKQEVAVADRLRRVDEVIDAVNLRKCAESLIGGPQAFIRGISGGERKRLSVATELLSDPEIIFADEPTSGLDAFMALSVCKILKGVASSGKLVVCVIHQPSSEIFELFSHLILLARGQTAYSGPRAQAVDYFAAQLGLECPQFYNPADYLIEKLAVNVLLEKPEVPIEDILRAYQGSDLALQNKAWLDEVEDGPGLSVASLVSSREFPATSWTQFAESYKRTVRSYAREPVLAKVRFGQAISMGLILGLVYLQQPFDSSATKNRLGAIFLLIMNQSIASMFTVSQVIPKDMAVFMREYLTSANRPSSYFLGLSLAEVPYQVLFPCIFGSIAYWLIGFAPEAVRFFTFLLTLVLMANASCSLGYALSTLTGHDGVAVALGPVLMLPMSLYAGVLHSSDNVPWYFVPLDKVSMIKYAFQAIVVNEYGSDKYDPQLRSFVFDYIGVHEGQIGSCLAMLVALLVGFRFLAYLFLLIRAKRALV